MPVAWESQAQHESAAGAAGGHSRAIRGTGQLLGSVLRLTSWRIDWPVGDAWDGSLTSWRYSLGTLGALEGQEQH